MSQHPSVGRFYDEHTQDLENSGRLNPQELYTLAAAMLEDGRQLSEDYERLEKALTKTSLAIEIWKHALVVRKVTIEWPALRYVVKDMVRTLVALASAPKVD